MTRDRLKTAVVGAGYVGIATAVGLAEQDRDIVLVEQDRDRLAALADGRIPFQVPELPEAHSAQYVAGRIVPSAEISGGGLELIVVCVGTPMAAGEIRERVVDRVNGYLVPLNDPEVLAAARRRLARDPELRSPMGDRSSEVIAAYTPPDRWAAAFESAVEAILSSRRMCSPS
jgi:glycosyltransferase involved in cell wall biosynthesis